MDAKQYIWINGRFVDFADAKVHVLTHSLQYGSGIFEGIRAYETRDGTAIFRLKEHMKRLVDTAKIYSMGLGYTQKQLEDATVETVRKNGPKSCYIRPFAFYDDNRIGLTTKGKKVSVMIAAVPFGAYFEGHDKGISCKIATWHRINSEILPVTAKASGNYLNSIIASEEAAQAGADEAILLSHNGYVAEGAGENIFLVRDNQLITPSAASDILIGITRDSIMKIAAKDNLKVCEREVHKDELYIADEVFFTGTAAEVTPIVRIDSKPIGTGRPGAITSKLRDRFNRIVHGDSKEFKEWLTYV
ncbi:MAG: branched-chain amino acid transaminase [Candidatus Micrarchaeota archaeon]|nr:branched-chain amino acid transaminase [Candidatus Micrarchaeota archaeon]